MVLWADLFDQLSTSEQNCLNSELGQDQFAQVASQPIAPDEPQWAPALNRCLDDERALALPGIMLFSLMVNQVLLGPAGQGEITPESRKCVQDLLAVSDVGGVFATILANPSATLEPNQQTMELISGILACAPDSAGPSPQPPGPHPTPNPDAFLWQQKLFDPTIGAPTLLLNAPAISDGVLFVGADDNNLHALDAATGQSLWTFETGDSVRTAATVANGIVYVGSNDNHLYALDARTGDLVWKHNTGDALQYPPLVTGDKVYVPTTSESGRNIHSLDAATGATIWVSTEDYPFDTGWEAGFGAATRDNLLFSVGYDGELHALDTATGETVWTSLGQGARTDTPPVVVDDLLYVTAVNTALALDPQSGETLWAFDTGRYPARGFPPVIDGDTFYFAPDDHLYALNTATGETEWEFVLDDMAATTPVVGLGIVFLPSQSGALYAIDQASGKALWTANPTQQSGTLESPDIHDGILYLESSDGFLLALDAMSGEVLWGLNKGFFSSVRTYTTSGGILYVASLQGIVYAIDPSSASPR